MLVFRSLSLGLLAACFALLVMRPTVELRVSREAQLAARPSPPVPTIIDVARGATNEQIASLIRLAPGEHVSTIDDAAVSGDLDAGVALASVALHARHFIDVGVAGPAGERRILVLLH